jgi:hypothetical protein
MSFYFYFEFEFEILSCLIYYFMNHNNCMLYELDRNVRQETSSSGEENYVDNAEIT